MSLKMLDVTSDGQRFCYGSDGGGSRFGSQTAMKMAQEMRRRM